MKLRAVVEAFDAISAGAKPSELESSQLDFKRDPATVGPPHTPRNPQARLVEEIVDAVICFANARGGCVVVGVDDKTPGPGAFVGTDVDAEWLRRRIYANTTPALTLDIDVVDHVSSRLLVISVPEGLDLVTDTKGKALRRTGTSCTPLREEERRAISHDRRNPDLTARVSERGMVDIDPAAVEQLRSLLRRLVDLRSSMADLPTTDLLRALNLVNRSDELLVAGEVLLCKPERDTVDLLTRSSAGAEPSVRRLRQPLVSALPHVAQLVHAGLDPEVGRLSLLDGQEIALPDISAVAVDEAVTNALVHRDWAVGDRVVIDQSPQSLRIWSPGSLPFGVSVERLLSTVSTPRNPALMAALQQLGLAERASRGIDRMFREQIRVGQTVPGIRADDYSVEVYFATGAPNRAFAAFIAGTPEVVRGSVDALLVLAWLCRHPTLSQAQAAGLLQVSEEEARHKVGLLTAHPFTLVGPEAGRRKGLRWRLLPRTAAALGTAVQHRTRADAARPQVLAHLAEYGWITNRTLRNMFDLDVQQATQMLSELRATSVIVKDPSGPQRGPSIRWLPTDRTSSGGSSRRTNRRRSPEP